MTELIIDLSNYRETSSARLDEGIYPVVVEDVELTDSRAGNKMIVLYYRVNTPGQAADGKMLIDRLTQTEGALFRTVAFMQAIGLPTPKKKMKLNLNAFLGKHLSVRVEDGEPYNGNIKSEVRDYFKAEGRSTAAEVEDLDVPEFEAPAVAEAAPVEAPQSDDLKLDEGPEVISLDDIDLG